MFNLKRTTTKRCTKKEQQQGAPTKEKSNAREKRLKRVVKSGWVGWPRCYQSIYRQPQYEPRLMIQCKGKVSCLSSPLSSLRLQSQSLSLSCNVSFSIPRTYLFITLSLAWPVYRPSVWHSTALRSVELNLHRKTMTAGPSQRIFVPCNIYLCVFHREFMVHGRLFCFLFDNFKSLSLSSFLLLPLSPRLTTHNHP